MTACSFCDGLVFSFTASVMLWQDLPPVQVAIILVVLFGSASVALGGGE
jgi:hypothetical protein